MGHSFPSDTRPRLKRAVISDEDRYLAGDTDTQYKFEIVLSPRTARGKTVQIFFAPAGQLRDLLNDERASDDLEAAMRDNRRLVFVFADARDVTVFRRRLPIFAVRGYEPDDRNWEKPNPPAPPRSGGGRLINAEMVR